MRYAVIYNDVPRPSFWLHPIKWWKHRRPVVAWVELDDGEPDAEIDGVQIWFGNPADVNIDLKVNLK